MKRILFPLLFLLSMSVFGQSFDVKYGTFRQYFLMVPMASPPSAPVKGMAYMDTDGQMYVYNGSAWVSGASQWSLSGSDITNTNSGTVIIDSLLKIWPMPPGVLAAHDNPYKFMVMGNDGRVWWANSLEASQMMDDTTADRAAAGDPPVTATWVRDTTNGFVVLADSTDLVGVGTNTPVNTVDIRGALNVSGGLFHVGPYVDSDLFVIDPINAGTRSLISNLDSNHFSGAVVMDSSFFNFMQIGDSSLALFTNTDGYGSWTINASLDCVDNQAWLFAQAGNYNYVALGTTNVSDNSSFYADRDSATMYNIIESEGRGSSVRVSHKNVKITGDTTVVTGDLNVANNISADTVAADYIKNQLYTLEFGTGVQNPADGDSTLFSLGVGATGALTKNQYKAVLYDSHITAAVISNWTPTAHTNENIVASVIVYDASLNRISKTTIETIGDTNGNKLFNNTSLNISVPAGYYVQLCLNWPTWATNPTGVQINGQVYLTKD